MPVYKDSKNNTWYVQLWVKDWAGTRKHKTKYGFKTKKEAKSWEMSIKSQNDVSLVMGFIINMYLKDMETKVELGTLKRSTFLIKANISKDT